MILNGLPIRWYGNTVSRFGCDLDGQEVSGVSAGIVFTAPNRGTGTHRLLSIGTGATSWWLELGSQADPNELCLHLPDGTMVATGKIFRADEYTSETQPIYVAFSAFSSHDGVLPYDAIRVFWYVDTYGEYSEASWTPGPLYRIPLSQFRMALPNDSKGEIVVQKAWASTLQVSGVVLRTHPGGFGKLLGQNPIFYYDLSRYACGSARDLSGGNHSFFMYTEPYDAGVPSLHTLALTETSVLFADETVRQMDLPARQYDRLPSVSLGSSHFPMIHSLEDRAGLRSLSTSSAEWMTFNGRSGAILSGGVLIRDVFMAQPSLSCFVHPIATAGNGWVDLVNLVGARLQVHAQLGVYRLATSLAATVLPFGANGSWQPTDGLIKTDSTMQALKVAHLDTPWCGDGLADAPGPSTYNLIGVQGATCSVVAATRNVETGELLTSVVTSVTHADATYGGNPMGWGTHIHYYPVWDDAGRCWIANTDGGSLEITDWLQMPGSTKYVVKSLFEVSGIGVCGLVCPLVGSGTTYVVVLSAGVQADHSVPFVPRAGHWYRLHEDSACTVVNSCGYYDLGPHFYATEPAGPGVWKIVRYRIEDLMAGLASPNGQWPVPSLMGMACGRRITNSDSVTDLHASTDGKSVYQLKSLARPIHLGIAVRSDHAVFWVDGIEYTLPHRRSASNADSYGLSFGQDGVDTWVSNLVLDQNVDMAPVTEPLVHDKAKARQWLAMLPVADFAGTSLVDALQSLSRGSQPMLAVQLAGETLLTYDENQRQVARYCLRHDGDVLRLEKQ